jgi:hypothetical protein
MTPEKRKDLWDKLNNPKPTWADFKRMLTFVKNDLNKVLILINNKKPR